MPLLLAGHGELGSDAEEKGDASWRGRALIPRSKDESSATPSRD